MKLPILAEGSHFFQIGSFEARLLEAHDVHSLKCRFAQDFPAPSPEATNVQLPENPLGREGVWLVGGPWMGLDPLLR